MRGGIEEGNKIKCPRTGVGVVYGKRFCSASCLYFSRCNYFEGFLKRGLGTFSQRAKESTPCDLESTLENYVFIRGLLGGRFAMEGFQERGWSPILTQPVGTPRVSSWLA